VDLQRRSTSSSNGIPLMSSISLHPHLVNELVLLQGMQLLAKCRCCVMESPGMSLVVSASTQLAAVTHPALLISLCWQ
jgi:hypothetical protein